jgi:hypothetical protein
MNYQWANYQGGIFSRQPLIDLSAIFAFLQRYDQKEEL